jgi:glycosyltransferase involved in cell wall biosynthesis
VNAIIIASKGRREILASTLRHLLRLVGDDTMIIVSATSSDDIAVSESNHPHFEFIFGPQGSCCQRNRALAHLGTRATDGVVFFLDDDILIAEDLVKNIAFAFKQNPSLRIAQGTIIYDGVIKGAISHETAAQILRDSKQEHTISKVRSVAGCALAMRGDLAPHYRFDEKLPLYGWLEDSDYGFRVSEGKGVIRLPTARCVHLGIRSGGRVSLHIFGYSQIANPLYLYRKGTLGGNWLTLVYYFLLRSVLSNILGTILADKQKQARLKGNWLALYDLFRGTLDPERIREL